jgi:hypothetical protein
LGKFGASEASVDPFVDPIDEGGGSDVDGVGDAAGEGGAVGDDSDDSELENGSESLGSFRTQAELTEPLTSATLGPPESLKFTRIKSISKNPSSHP